MGFLSKSMVGLVYYYCLFRENEEDTSEEIVVGGLGTYIIFHAERIGERLVIIREMLAELPDTFRTEVGDRFENAYITRTGEHWATSEDMWEVEMLFQLGIACGFVRCDLPREPWGEHPLFRVCA